VLPVLNAEAVRMAVKFGLAIGATIASRSIFARKNYFYPIAEGYQISQYEHPVVSRGSLTVMLDDGKTKTIGVTRAHLEEDAGKSLHEGLANASGIDLNRAGTPLLEIVSEPDMRSAKEAVAYMKKSTRWCDISRSATATCRKARSAATPMSRCGRAARKSSGHAPKSRT